MKNSTFSAQVANNLLTVLQGYSKTIRLLLVMLLTLTASTAWGAKITTYSSIVTGKTYYIGATTGGTDYYLSVNGAATSTSIAGTAVTTKANATAFVFTGSGTSWKIKFADYANYLGLKNSKDNGKVQVVSSAADFTASNQSEKLRLSIGNYSIQKNNSGTQFGSYGNTQTDIWLEEASADPYTVTLNAGPGTCAASVTEASAGDGVTLPTPTLDCGDWEFAGWKTTSAVTTETTTEPTLIPAGAYSPTSNITLYAVYQRTEGGGGGGSVTSQTDEVTISNFGTGTSTRTYSATYADWTWAKNSGSNIATYDEIRLYASHSMKISPKSGYTISSIVATCTNGSYASALAGSSLSGADKSVSGSTVTISPTSGDIIITQAAQSRVSKFTVTYSTTAGGTTYYHSTPDCATGDPCDALQAPNVTATATANSITLTWAAVDGATSYNIYNYTTEDLDETTSLTYTFTGLSSETEYEWEVDAVSATCNGKGTTGTTTTSATPCEKLGAATGLTVVTDFVQDGQTYVKFSWTPADNTKANATSQKICFGKVDEAGTCVDNLAKNLTWTGDLKSKLEPGEYWWSIQALGDGVNYCDGDVVNGTNFTIEAPKASITLSELGVTSTIDTYSVGDQYTLPTTSSQSCAGKQLVGWSTVEVAETDTKPTENYYELGAEVTLAATQTFYAVFAAGSGGGGEGWTAVTSTSDLEAGATYAISSAATEGTYLSTWDGGNNFPGSTSIICPLILGGSAGAWTFQIADGGTYNDRFLTAASTTSSNYLKAVTTADAYSVFTISFEATNKNAVITCTGKASRNILRYNANNGSPIFACYTSGQSATYLQKYATSGGGYSAYSTSCIPTYSITYDFAGGTGSHCANTSVPQGDPYTICEEEPTKEGYTFQGWSDGTSTYAAGATITPTKNTTLTAQWQIKTYTVTWSNNGTPTPVEYNHGVALVVPEEPESCDGVKEFVGWTEQSGYYHATTAPTDLFKTTTATVIADKTYYAVFATPPGTGGGGGGSETTIDDVLTRETTEITDGTTTYSAWSGKKVTSSAVYAGNSAGGNNAIQLRSNNSTSGIVTTTSGGKVTHVEVDWESNTASDRTLDIYGRNVAYSAATDLYSTSTQGTKLGSIVCGTSTELEITGDYEYIGLRSKSGAMYLTSVTITWSSAGGSSSYTDYTTICQEVTGIAISGSYPTAFVQYDSFSFAGGIVTATFENGATQDVTSLATFSGYNMDEVGVQTVTVTYMGQTAKYEITINQSDRWRLTWNVSGKTNTGASPIYVQKGSAIGTLPTPEVPAACAGKTFMGWTTSNIVPSDGKGIVYITEATVPTKNTTYYAVFATINNFSTQAAIEDIEDGSKVVIVAVASMDASGGSGQAISSRTISITSQGVIGLSGDEVSIFDETINTPHSTCIWTLTKEGGGIVFEQGGKYIRAVNNGYRRLLLETTKDYWTLSPVGGKDKTYHMQSGNTSHYVEWFDHTDSKYDEGERYIGFVPYTEANDNGDFDMQFYVTANADGEADITDYTTGCAEYTITYYGFHGGYSTSCSSDGTIVLPVNSLHTVPNCGDVVKDHTNLGREFLNVWMTQPHGGHTFKPGDTFILTQDTTLYAQWKLNTQNDFTTLPTDVEDLAGTDVYVYGGKTLTLQPGTTTINSLTLKGGLQADGSYKMPTVWVPEGATLVRNSNKIYLDLVVNAKNYYPFAVPFATKNDQYIDYLDPDLNAASTYDKHFVIKTYDGARRATQGEDRANNWVKVLRHQSAENPSYLQPGVGYIITALTYPDKDTATIRIPMTVPNTWFKNGEQAEVGTTVRNTIAVTAHAGAAATEHKRHAGWNFVANPYLTSFVGGNVANDGGLDYINGELIIQGSYEYTDEEVPYVTIPAYDFAYYSQLKLSEVKLSPEWSFFVQVGTGGTMNFTTAGRQQAPASIAARNAEERPVKMDVDLILSDNHSSDQTGLIICDRYTDAYEIGRDLEKLFGSAYNLSVYTLMEDNTPLAFQALAIRSSMQVIPVGYRAPEQGEYTFRLNEATSSIDLLNEQYEQLVLVDYQTGELTNLLYTDYTFYSERTQSNSRFAIYAVPRQNAPTDLPNAIGSDEEVRKVIYNDHLYILRDGNVYNGMGQKM